VKEFLKTPLVGIEEEEPEYTLEDYIVFAAAIADGLNWEDDYANSIECVYQFADLGIRLEAAKDLIWNITRDDGLNPLFFGDVLKKEEVYEMALALGNVSTTYKMCWDNAQNSLLDGFNWVAQFPSF
jgi:hypothetical protein